jgi:hypothetical protein
MASHHTASLSLVDALSRFVANVGVPAAIAFFVLYQVTPRLDAQTQAVTNLNTQLAVISVACTSPVRTVYPPTFPP